MTDFQIDFFLDFRGGIGSNNCDVNPIFDCIFQIDFRMKFCKSSVKKNFEYILMFFYRFAG